MNNTKTHALRIIRQHKAVWHQPPTHIDTNQFSDAPMFGNGDVGVVLAGTPECTTFYLGKSEFISLTKGAQKSMTRLVLSAPSLTGADYYAEMDLAEGKVRTHFEKGETTLSLVSWMQATDTTNNLLFTKLSCTGSQEIAMSATFLPGLENLCTTIVSMDGDILVQDTRADEEDQIDGDETARVRSALRLIGGQAAITDGTLAFTLQPGAKLTLAVSIMSNFDSLSYRTQSVHNVKALTAQAVDDFDTAHQAWWQDFWGRSFVEIPDKIIEKQYYGSLYYLASCIRKGEYAPGLYGGWAIKDPCWAGIAPINYNYQAPYYCTVPTNHLELADGFDKQILEWMPYARKNAEEVGLKGLYFEGYPKGSMFFRQRWSGLDQFGRDCYMCQKSNGLLAATNMILRYYHTKDMNYAKLVYPEYLKGVSDFWLDYLTWDGSRYVIENDYVHEGPVRIFPQTNPLTSLGCLRLLLQALIDISTALNVDAELRPIWQDRLEKLSDYPTYVRNGQVIFKNQESGTSAEWSKECGYDDDLSVWSTCCAVPEMALMYPGSQIGMFSEPGILAIAKDTVTQQAKWLDDNMTCFFYPSAVRVGHDPDEILAKLANMIQTKTYTNMANSFQGGGIENFNAVPATLVEMFCQSFQGKVKLFANWPANTMARFGDLLIYGNFLVSSCIRDNKVQYARFISGSGEDLVLINPWPGRTVWYYRNGERCESLTGEMFTLTTQSGEILHLAPEGVSYQEILKRMG